MGFLFLMILRPPSSTRTDTLFPYTTLFRSGQGDPVQQGAGHPVRRTHHHRGNIGPFRPEGEQGPASGAAGRCDVGVRTGPASGGDPIPDRRSEERREGKECVSKCRSRCSTYHYKNKIKKKTKHKQRRQ